MNNRSLIIVLGAFGVALIAAFVAIVLLYEGGDKTAILLGLSTLAGVGYNHLMNMKQGAESAAQIAQVEQKVEQSAVVSQENRHVLAAVSQQTGQALEQLSQELATNTKTTEATHEMANGQLTAALREIRDLKDDVADLKQQRAAREQADGRGETSEARIIAAVEAGPTTKDAP